MKVVIRYCLGVVALCCLVQAPGAQDAAKASLTAPNLESITVGDLKGDVYFLASDEMRGRDTAKPESDIASAYIASRFRKAGALPAGDNGSYFQDVQFAYHEFVEPPVLKLYDSQNAGTAVQLKYGQDFSTAAGKPMPVAKCEVVFAGYAVTDAARGWDDLGGLDIRGKAALILRYEPTGWRSGSSMRGWSRNSYLETKAALLRKAGAAAVLMVTGPASTGGIDNWVPLGNSEINSESPPLALADEPEQQTGLGLPFFSASVKAADQILGEEGALKRLQEALDKGDRKAMPDLSSRRLEFDVKTRQVFKSGRNVIAKVEGDLDEWVVLGGHYDHIGLGYFGATDARTAIGKVHNGADDNASGTSAILEIAEAFAGQRKPRRSFLFIAFTGEEKGLLGSAWYARHPVVPHEKTLAMINIDMIGRVKNRRLEMHGMASSKALAQHVRDCAPLFPELSLKFNEQPVGPVSDMWAFYQAGVPVLFPFSGYNEEMHSIKDRPETINYEGLSQATRLVAEIAWRVSETQAYPDYRGTNKDAIGPDGQYRIPRPNQPKPAPKEKPPEDSEKEEEFSMPRGDGQR
ncbi:MAG: hypothetical protein BroJett014_11840 [Planctomycetota bacterium]|nr:hypothetical protein [Planctomycetota bacterium]GIK52211.1 MAG: hypothetical protein BroJett014_11840 [Planctomycetota bacterium]